MPETRVARPTPLLLLIGVPVVAVLIAMAAMYIALVKGPADAALKERTDLLLRLTLPQPVTNKLDPAYTDADGDFVADPPTDPAKFVNPDTLRISYVATEEPEAFELAFAEFVANLARVTGKKVEYVPVKSADEQLRGLRDGTLHLTGFNTGNVPRAVNVAGFVPLAVLGDATGDFRHRSLIVVPAKSEVTSLAGLKGRELWLTEPGSNSGYRSPLLLMRAAGLLPERDYLLRYSGGHDGSIERIASGEAVAAGVASDVLARAVARGVIGAEGAGYRVLDKSEAFPSAAMGYPHDLDPALVAKIRTANLDFNWAGTALEKEFAASGKTKFVPVNYKDDFALVRKIDDDTGTKHTTPR